MSKQKNILVLTPFFSPNTGGVETHLDDLVEYLANKDYQVYVLTYQPLMNNIKVQSIERKPNLEIRRIKWFRGNLFSKFEPYPLLQSIYLVPRLLISVIGFMLKHKNDIDIIHAQGVSAAFVARITKFFFRKKIVVSTHAVYGWLYNMKQGSFFARIIKCIFNGFDQVLTLSEQSRNELIKIGVNPEKVVTYRYWVNQDVFKPKDIPRSKFKVLFVGRLIEIKGILTLIKVARKNKDMTFVFIGEGPLLGRIKEAAKDDNIIFLGRVKNTELSSWYNDADVVVMPSLYEEGYGRVILEALSCGTPVIASNRGGIKEVLTDSVGMLIEPTEEEITKALKEINLEKLSKNCRPYAEKMFSSNNALVIEKAYKE
ncbi:MAG: glycosyltransferase family 4 protein [Candidatus Saelkia tenebricola]|nr:glycosyltransferase family 4 protein [Candidatus Saelkia tenebricola]